MKNKFYVLRHAESIANRQGIIVSDPKNGIPDYGLTTRGVQQVAETALKTRIDHNVQIVTSDFKRAKETADIFHSVLSVEKPIICRQELRERYFGEWEFKDICHYNTVWEADENAQLDPGFGVESVEQVLKRVMKLMLELDDAAIGQTYLLVGHGDVLQILLCYFHNLEPKWHRHIPVIKNAEIRSLIPTSLVKEIA